MTTAGPSSLKDLLGSPDTAVGRLLRRSAEIDALTTEVRQLLPDTLKPHLLAASVNDLTLCLVADSAVWAARMRYDASEILTSLPTTQGRSLQKIRVSVAAGLST